MNKVLIVIVLLAVLAGGLLVLYPNRPAQQATPIAPATDQSGDISRQWETKTDDQEGVTIVVTPLDLSPQSAEWKFDVGINTHSVELDQDMTAVAVLTDEQGKEYKPVGWEGAPAGGHHREGVLTFSALKPMPRSVGLTIKDIGDIPERLFKWDLK